MRRPVRCRSGVRVGRRAGFEFGPPASVRETWLVRMQVHYGVSMTTNSPVLERQNADVASRLDEAGGGPIGRFGPHGRMGYSAVAGGESAPLDMTNRRR